MRRVRALVYGIGLAGLVAVLTPVWFVHLAVSRLRAPRRPVAPVAVPRVDASTVSLAEVMSTGTPVILEGLVGELGLDGAATPDALRALAADHRVTMRLFDAARPYFLYSGGYDTVELSRRDIGVDELLDTMFDTGVDDGAVVYQLFGTSSLGGEIGDVLARFDDAVRPRVERATEPRFSGVWIGSPGAVTPLHHDAWPGLLFQTHGRKRLAMYPPGERAQLSFCSPLRGAGRWTDLPGRSADATPDRFPRFHRARRHEGELGPGDVLFIPAYWAHEMEAETANISVPFRFAATPSTYLDPGFLRPASELLRKQVRVLAGR